MCVINVEQVECEVLIRRHSGLLADLHPNRKLGMNVAKVKTYLINKKSAENAPRDFNRSVPKGGIVVIGYQ